MVLYNEVLRNMVTNKGDNVHARSKNTEVLLVFLRHFGCTFCREALEELSTLQPTLQDQKVELILVHMSTEEIAEKYFNRYNLNSVLRVADPECQYYRKFGLLKGTFNQLFGFRSWFRGIEAGLIKGHGYGKQLGDGFQMPGVFKIFNGKILSEFRHKYPSDKPDYLRMVGCAS